MFDTYPVRCYIRPSNVGHKTTYILDFTLQQGLPPAATANDWLVTSGLSVNVTIADMYNTTQGYTCYRYQDPLDEKKGQDF